MRHRLLPTATASLWVINVIYVIAIPAWPRLDDFDSGQRLLVGITIAVTLAWLLRREGIEYRIGYRHGRSDQKK